MNDMRERTAEPVLPDPEKAKKYARIKLTASLLNTLLYVLFVLSILFTGFSYNLSMYFSSITSNVYVSLLLFTVTLGFARLLIGFPLKYSIGFKTERRYDLSDQSFRSWLWQGVKANLISLVITIPVLLLFYFFLRKYGELWWIPTGMTVFVFSVLLGKLAPTLIFPLFYKFEPLSSGTLQEKIKKMAEEVGMKLQGVYSFNLSKTTKKANAAFAGFGKSKRVLLGDTLLNLMPDNEVLTVLAHELGHYRLKHIPKLIAASAITTFLGLYLAAELYSATLGYFGFASLTDIGGLPLLSLWLMLYSFITGPISNSLSREYERQADRFAVELSGDSGAFESALKRLAGANLSDVEPHPAVEFMFHSHPAINKRLRAIRSYGTDRS
ncbi:MAG: M48 family metallopeptidase [Candidatus Marinimicrobia bacterium]|nr:M48 family metallopeptidase [Candidatus Neomarinimicrobiota bacterium]